MYICVHFTFLRTWSLALWDEYRLRVYRNTVLKRIFGARGKK